MANAFLITDILFLSLTIIMLILSILTLTLSSSKDEYFQEARENFVLSPIFDLSLKNTITSCPNNQEVLPLGEWKGTKTGCDCIGLSAWLVPITSADRYTVSYCTKDEVRGGCRTVPSSPPKNFTVWKGKEFCASHSKQTYEDYLKDAVGINEICKEDYHPCGILDSLNQTLCLPNRDKCPINKIIFNQSPIAPVDYKYKTLSFGSDNGYVHYTNEAIDQPILVKMKLSEGEVCVNPGQYNSKYEDDQFKLDEIGDNYGCHDIVGQYIYDTRFTVVDNSLKSIVFPENEIYNFFSSIRGFPAKYSQLAKQAEMQLYQRNYIGLNRTCIEQTKFSQKNNDKRIKQNNTVSNCHIGHIVLISLLIAYILIVLLCKCCNGSYDKQDLSTSYYVLVGSYCILLIPIFALALNCYLVFNGIHVMTYCGDDIFNSQLRIAQKEIDLFEVIDITIASFAILSILMHITLVIYLKRNTLCSDSSDGSGTDGTKPIERDNAEGIKDPEEQSLLKEKQDYSSSNVYPPPVNVLQSVPTGIPNAGEGVNINNNNNKDNTKYQSGSLAI